MSYTINVFYHLHFPNSFIRHCINCHIGRSSFLMHVTQIRRCILEFKKRAFFTKTIVIVDCIDLVYKDVFDDAGIYPSSLI